MNKLLLLLVGVLAFTGCSALREADSSSKEKVLVASGFQAQVADTPKKQAALAAITPYKIHMVVKKGRTMYVYADAKHNTLYLGGKQEYLAYKKEQTALNADQMMTAEAAETEMDWDVWSPWKWD
jgi:hypothetical protein